MTSISSRGDAPGAGASGNLLPQLIALTFTTGVIDAVSFVGLGKVFTANMTGNIVFLGFALADVEGLSVERSLVALGSFAAGALVGGLVTNRGRSTAMRQLAMVAAAEAGILAVAAAVGIGQSVPPSWYAMHGLIVLTGIAMGLRNAIVRKLAVPDITTTVLTLTITGLAADSRIAGGSGARRGRKLLSIVAIAIGAMVGAMMLNAWGFTPPLMLTAGLAGVVSLSVAWQLNGRAARSVVTGGTRA